DAFDSVREQNLPRVRAGKGISAYVLRTGEPLLGTREELLEMERRGELELLGAPSVDWLGVPLQRGDKPFGIIAGQTYSADHRLGEQEKELLTFIAPHVANAIERKVAEARVRESEERFSTV